MQWALPSSKARPAKARTNAGKLSRYCRGPGQAQRLAGSVLNARVNTPMAGSASAGEAVAIRAFVVVGEACMVFSPGGPLKPQRQALGDEAVEAEQIVLDWQDLDRPEAGLGGVTPQGRRAHDRTGGGRRLVGQAG